MIPSALYPLVSALLANVVAQVGKRSFIISSQESGIFTGSLPVVVFQAPTVRQSLHCPWL